MKVACEEWIPPGPRRSCRLCSSSQGLQESRPDSRVRRRTRHGVEDEGEEGELPPLLRPGQVYETPIAGEGFWADVFGYRIEIQPNDRSSFSAWTSGLIWTPNVDDYEFVPYGALYFWRRPDDDHFFRATLVGVANELTVRALSSDGWGRLRDRPRRSRTTHPGGTGPSPWTASATSRRSSLWGTVRTGVGVGWRQDRWRPTPTTA